MVPKLPSLIHKKKKWKTSDIRPKKKGGGKKVLCVLESSFFKGNNMGKKLSLWELRNKNARSWLRAHYPGRVGQIIDLTTWNKNDPHPPTRKEAKPSQLEIQMAMELERKAKLYSGLEKLSMKRRLQWSSTHLKTKEIFWGEMLYKNIKMESSIEAGIERKGRVMKENKGGREGIGVG